MFNSEQLSEHTEIYTYQSEANANFKHILFINKSTMEFSIEFHMKFNLRNDI